MQVLTFVFNFQNIKAAGDSYFIASGISHRKDWFQVKFSFDGDNIVYLSRYFNKNFFSQTPTMEKQDSKFTRKIRKAALEKMNGAPEISDSKSFYVGSMDFMVMEKNGKHEFAILESNGGSTRGILAISEEQTEMIFNAYKHAIDQSSDKEDRKLVIIGTIANDTIFQEKILLIEYLKHRYTIEGLEVGVYNSLNFTERKKTEDITLVIANYNNLFQGLSYRKGNVFFMGDRVDVLIGDGIARRYPILGAYCKYDPNKIDVSVVNKIYQVCDDKASTYLAAHIGKETLDEYRVRPLMFYKAQDPYHLEEALGHMVSRFQKNFVIKPFGGSGGAGVLAVPKTSRPEDLPEIMDNSIFDFYKKFDKRRNPFPYTIQEMANFKLIDWDNSKRTFDIRIYVAQKEGCLYPVGGTVRISRAPYTGSLKKDEFVVNICGPWGAEVERALGFSEEAINILNITEEDLMDMFCASCQFFRIASERHLEILCFENWDVFIK